MDMEDMMPLRIKECITCKSRGVVKYDSGEIREQSKWEVEKSMARAATPTMEARGEMRTCEGTQPFTIPDWRGGVTQE